MEDKILKILKRHYNIGNNVLKSLLLRAKEKGYNYVVLDQNIEDYSSWHFEKDVRNVDFAFGVYVFSINNLITIIEIKNLIP